MTEQEAQALAFKRNKGLSKFQAAEKIWVATSGAHVPGWGVQLVDKFAHMTEHRRKELVIQYRMNGE